MYTKLTLICFLSLTSNYAASMDKPQQSPTDLASKLILIKKKAPIALVKTTIPQESPSSSKPNNEPLLRSITPTTNPTLPTATAHNISVFTLDATDLKSTNSSHNFFGYHD